MFFTKSKLFFVVVVGLRTFNIFVLTIKVKETPIFCNWILLLIFYFSLQNWDNPWKTYWIQYFYISLIFDVHLCLLRIEEILEEKTELISIQFNFKWNDLWFLTKIPKLRETLKFFLKGFTKKCFINCAFKGIFWIPAFLFFKEKKNSEFYNFHKFNEKLNFFFSF